MGFHPKGVNSHWDAWNPKGEEGSVLQEMLPPTPQGPHTSPDGYPNSDGSGSSSEGSAKQASHAVREAGRAPATCVGGGGGVPLGAIPGAGLTGQGRCRRAFWGALVSLLEGQVSLGPVWVEGGGWKTGHHSRSPGDAGPRGPPSIEGRPGAIPSPPPDGPKGACTQSATWIYDPDNRPCHFLILGFN